MRHNFKTTYHIVISIVFMMAFLYGCDSRNTIKTQKFSAVLKEAPEIKFPVPADCSCPVHWDGDTMHIFCSLFQAKRLSGPNLFELGNITDVQWDRDKELTRWIEATYKDEDGTLYGWYHHERGPACANRMPEKFLVTPIIGAGVSNDNGATWKDLGFVIQDDPNTYNCDTVNFYFAGGSGDFCVNVDKKKEYIYFMFNTYDRKLDQQGVCVARMRFADRKDPSGKVLKWHKNDWSQPGLYGKVTPIFDTVKDWHSSTPDSLWGPAIHYNTYLKSYVMLLNRAIDPNWLQEGIYISYNKDLADCTSWTKPEKLKSGGQWYPLVIGTNKYETNTLLGRKARYFEQGTSWWEIEFSK